MSPQQPDGISNIRSWNVRNAGQSDLTKRERVERTDKSVKTQKEEESRESRVLKEIWQRVAQQKSQGLNTACHCEHKDKGHCLWKEWPAMEQETYSLEVEVVAAIVDSYDSQRSCVWPEDLYCTSSSLTSFTPTLKEVRSVWGRRLVVHFMILM